MLRGGEHRHQSEQQGGDVYDRPRREEGGGVRKVIRGRAHNEDKGSHDRCLEPSILRGEFQRRAVQR